MPPKGSGSEDPKVIHRATNSIDRAIGKQIKHHRIAAALSEDVCAGKIGVSAQTLGAYERAKERVPASHLSLLAKALGVPVETFFERPEAKPQKGRGDNVVPLLRSRKRQPAGAASEGQLLESFRAIDREADRQLVIDIAARLAKPCCSASGS